MNKLITGDIIKLLLVTLLVKVAYILFAHLLDNNINLLDFENIASIFYRNDSSWYEKIATNLYPQINDLSDLGYANGPDIKQSEWAFFPQYPLLVRWLMNFSLSFKESGFILLIILSITTVVGFFLFASDFLKERRTAFYCTLIFIVFPFNYYFSMMYTEALFFSLLIFSFIAINRKKYYFIPFLLIPLVLTRSLGLVCLLPLYLFYLEKEGILTGYRINFKELISKRNLLRSMIFATGPLAFLVYMVYQQQLTGSYFAFSLAQAGWGRTYRFPLLVFFSRGDLQTQFNSIYTILVVLLWVLNFRKFPLSLNIFIFLAIFIPLTSGQIISQARFISIIFPLTILVGAWLWKFRFKYIFILLMFGLQLFVFTYWLSWHPFSY